MGLGHLAAKHLVYEGHNVVLHARNEKRAGEALAKVPGAEHALAADLAIPEEVKRMAAEANALATFDAVIIMQECTGLRVMLFSGSILLHLIYSPV
jgi:NAD(P)-dependent dehydrogenase (short-subunit alcohol dehydrogenase family)